HARPDAAAVGRGGAQVVSGRVRTGPRSPARIPLAARRVVEPSVLHSRTPSPGVRRLLLRPIRRRWAGGVRAVPDEARLARRLARRDPRRGRAGGGHGPGLRGPVAVLLRPRPHGQGDRGAAALVRAPAAPDAGPEEAQDAPGRRAVGPAGRREDGARGTEVPVGRASAARRARPVLPLERRALRA